MYHRMKLLVAQLSDETCNILSAFHVLIGCDYKNRLEDRKFKALKKCV